MAWFGFLAAAPALPAVFAWCLAYWSTHPIRIPVPGRPPPDLGAYEDVTLTTSDGLRLSGWYFPASQQQAVIVLCHGHQFHRCQMLDVMRGLSSERFGFLMFDFRCAGRSGGRISTIGADEVADLIAAVDWLKARPDTACLPIGVFGYSMGGAAALLAAAADERIRAVASQGAYASLARAIRDRGRFFAGVLGPLVSIPAMAFGRMWLRHNPADIAPVQVVCNIAPRPVMICHGEWDPFIAPADARALFEAAGPPKDLRIVPRSWHIGIDDVERPAYFADLRAFFERHLLSEPGVPLPNATDQTTAGSGRREPP